MIFHNWEGPSAMRTVLSVTFLSVLISPFAQSAWSESGQASKEQVAQFEASGDLMGAKALLSRDAEANAGDAAAQQSLAEFLCRR